MNLGSEDLYTNMRKHMMKIDKLVKSLDNEMLIYTLNRIADEMDTRSNEMELKHKKQQKYQKRQRLFGIIGK